MSRDIILPGGDELRLFDSQYTPEQIEALLTRLMTPGGIVTADLADGTVTWPKLAEDARPNRDNLLDNACWAVLAAIINQRGVSGTIATPGYFIDRWKLVSGSVTLASNGLILNGTIAQIVDRPIISDVTASVLTETGIVPGEFDPESKTFSITATGVRLIAAKLELGDHQTLAYQDADGNWVLNEIPDYGTALAKCQRYIINLINPAVDPYYCILGIGQAQNTSNVFIFIPLPVEMRDSKPTISYSGNIRIVKNTSAAAGVVPTSIVFDHMSRNGIVVKATGSFNPGDIFFLWATPPAPGETNSFIINNEL